MPTPTEAYYLRWQFDLNRAGTSEDIALFGLWFDTGDGVEFGDEQLAKVAFGGWKAWQEHVDAGFWTDNVKLSSVVASAYLANGHTLHEQNYVAGDDWVGLGDPPALPWETAMAVSLYTYPRGTFVSNGKRKRGRFYLPPMCAGALDDSNSGFFKDSNFAGFLANMKTFLSHAGEDDEGVQVGTLSVFSRADSVLRHVSQISMDAKIDSQRRRQNRETAGHSELSFP